MQLSFINFRFLFPPRSVRSERPTTTVYVPSQACRHSGRALAKLLLERTLVSDSSDLYLTPNCTLTGPPDVVPRHDLQSPALSDYRTPDSTIGTPENTFAMPTYFDKKKKAAATIISSAVEPLTNFQIFKQKSLNTIPALVEKNNKRNEELFNNFPFLTPLANRKSSLVSNANRLSGCIEDEFYCIPSDPEADAGSAERVDIRHKFRSLSNEALDKETVFTSTPKEEAKGVFAKVASLRHSYSGHAR